MAKNNLYIVPNFLYVNILRMFSQYIRFILKNWLRLYLVDQKAIGLWKYVRMEVLACLKNQVENYFKINNHVNNQNSKTFRYIFYKAWK